MAPDIPFGEGQSLCKDRFRELQRVFEVQALNFQQMAVVESLKLHSIVNGKPVGRPHGYTDIVSLQANGKGESTPGTPEEWLSFDAFLNPEVFWELKSESEVPGEPWEPSKRAAAALKAFPLEQLPEDGLPEALAFRYWRNISSRAFDQQPKFVPIRVCLGPEKQSQAIIQQAKAFFLQHLLPLLPEAAEHIISFSAPFPSGYVHVLASTALVFLYPEENVGSKSEYLFDLRGGGVSFVPLAEEELAFMRQLKSEGSTLFATLRALYERSRSVLNNRFAMRETPFMADFDVAWLLFRLTRETESEAIVQCWKALESCLETRHGLTEADADVLLLELAAEWLKRIEKQPETMGEEAFAFLLHKALFGKDEKFVQKILSILVAHQRAGAKPFFAQVLPSLQGVREERVQVVFKGLLQDTGLISTLDVSQRDALCAPVFTTPALASLPAKKQLEAFSVSLLGKRRDDLFFLLPVAGLYMDRQQLWKVALEELLAQYTEQLPDVGQCKELRAACGPAADDNRERLCQYCTEAFFASKCAEYAEVCVALEVDMDALLRSTLARGQKEFEKSGATIDLNRLQALIDRLPQQSISRVDTQNELNRYAQAVLNSAAQKGNCELRWYVKLDANRAGGSRLIENNKRIETGMAHYQAAYLASGRVPAEEDFKIVLGWLGDRRAKQLADGLKAVYEPLGEAAWPQVSQLWNVFSTVSDTPNLRRLYVRALQAELQEKWKQEEYFSAINAQRPRWSKGSVLARELLQSPGVQQQACENLKKRLALRSTLQDLEKEQSLYGQQKQTAAEFAALFEEKLARWFEAHYEALLLQQESLQEIETVRGYAAALGVGQRITLTAADRCAVQFLVVQKEMESLSTLPEQELTRAAQQWMGRLSMEHTALYTHMQELLYQQVRSIPLTRLRARFARMLAVAGPPREMGYRAEMALSVLPWELEKEKPFGDAGIVLFSQLCALLSFAQQVHEGCAPLLFQGMRQQHSGYMKKLSEAQKEAGKWVPWLTQPDAAQALQPYRELAKWLGARVK